VPEEIRHRADQRESAALVGDRQLRDDVVVSRA
jgi:hypothetical protein